jgi:hypothetical protein
MTCGSPSLKAPPSMTTSADRASQPIMRCGGWRIGCASAGESPVAVRASVLAAAFLVSACSTPPVADHELRLHLRDDSRQRFGYEVESADGREVGVMGESDGCHSIALPWTISVGPVGTDIEHGDYQPVANSTDYGDEQSIEVWIVVSTGGQVTSGQGKPTWGNETARCGPARYPTFSPHRGRHLVRTLMNPLQCHESSPRTRLPTP